MTTPILMIMPGTHWQLPLINRASQLGFLTLVVSPEKIPIVQAQADFHECADVLDKKACLAIAKRFVISAVATEQSDIALETISYIAKKLKLKALTANQVEKCSNKYSMRKFCLAENIAIPRFALCSSKDAITELVKTMSFPLIIKPLDSNSSRGVFKLENEVDIAERFPDSLKYSKSKKAVLVEEYIDGPEFTVDGIVTGDGHRSLGISKKKHFRHNQLIAKELFFTSSNLDFDYEELKQLNNHLYQKLALPDGTLTHAEYKYCNGNFVQVEYAARGGGNLVASHIIPFISGYDSYGRYLAGLHDHVGDDTDVFDSDVKCDSRAAVLRFFDVECGQGQRLRAIEGADALETTSEIVSYRFNVAVGDEMKNPENDSKRLGYYIALSEDKSRLEDLITELSHEIKFICEPL